MREEGREGGREGRGSKGTQPYITYIKPSQSPEALRAKTLYRDSRRGTIGHEETFKNRGRRRWRWRRNDVTNELMVTTGTIFGQGRFPEFC